MKTFHTCRKTLTMVRFKFRTVFLLGVLLFASLYVFDGVINTRTSSPDAIIHRDVLSPKYALGSKSTVRAVQEQTISQKRSSKYSSSANSTLYTSTYLLNSPSMCSSVPNLTLIVVVHTATANFNKRLGIRQTWANPAHYKGFTMRTVFFLGRPQNARLQPAIEAESRQFHDIVQGPFLDTYRNITYKGVMVFQWIYEFCAEAEMILKTDDDMFVNIFSIVQSRLPVMFSRRRQMMCEVVRNGRIRRHPERWAIRPEELPGRREYPTYCRGYQLLITPDLIEPMLDTVPSVPFFWIDDVYLYGLLPEFLGVRWQYFVPRIPDRIEQCFKDFHDDNKRVYRPPDGCLNVPGRDEMVSLWATAIRSLPVLSRDLLAEHTFYSWIQPIQRDANHGG